MNRSSQPSAARSTVTRFRCLRRLTFLLAMLPLFQGIGACGTGIGQVLGNVVNSFPALSYNAAQNVFLLPFEILLSLATGGTGTGGSGGLGGSSGLGGSGGLGSSGLGGSSGI